ncbi:amino acid ABC transporter permease [Cupriavidus sp. GA3-3]|uniref:amino acid ABC transporter permease n=1 Tax=Cupriavidus sp. GA3-3 TaxID=1229514 RepID=UPI00039A641E|nr:amino acid ABC transporter permease [Cupriavidus sp. GA3-3]
MPDGMASLPAGLALVWGQLPYLLKGAFPEGPLAGAALTLWIAALACAGATVLGIALALLLELAPSSVTRVLRAVLALLRAVPVLMLIFWTYFLLPMLAGVQVSEVLTVVLALALVGAAFIAQSLHAGIGAIGAGQRQAALALGMSRTQALWHVVLPQALRAMLPSLANTWVALTKDTSLAYIVGVSELSTLATQVNGRSMGYAAEVFAAVALLYFVLCVMIEAGAAAALRRLQGSHRRGRAEVAVARQAMAQSARAGAPML